MSRRAPLAATLGLLLSQALRVLGASSSPLFDEVYTVGKIAGCVLASVCGMLVRRAGARAV